MFFFTANKDVGVQKGLCNVVKWIQSNNNNKFQPVFLSSPHKTVAGWVGTVSEMARRKRRVTASIRRTTKSTVARNDLELMNELGVIYF